MNEGGRIGQRVRVSWGIVVVTEISADPTELEWPFKVGLNEGKGAGPLTLLIVQLWVTGCPWRGHITLGVAALFEGRRAAPTEGFEGQQLPTFLTTWGVNDLILQGAVGSTPQHPYTSDADIGKH